MTPRTLKLTFTAHGWRIWILVLLVVGPWVIGVATCVSFAIFSLRH
jgi:hypothetical protein